MAVAPTVAICEGLFAVPRVIETLRRQESFVVKPASGSGGDGILVIGSRADQGWRTVGGRSVSEDELRQHLANVVFGAYSKHLDDRALIEERIIPHPLMEDIYARGLSDIRVILLRGRPLMSMMRVPTDRSQGRANLHQGGIGVAVDITDGRLTRAVYRRESVTSHPDTGTRLVGEVLPGWTQLLEVARAAAACVPLGYVGVDIVLDKSRGPLVLEMNARPGLEIQNINGQGLAPAVRSAAG